MCGRPAEKGKPRGSPHPGEGCDAARAEAGRRIYWLTPWQEVTLQPHRVAGGGAGILPRGDRGIPDLPKTTPTSTYERSIQKCQLLAN